MKLTTDAPTKPKEILQLTSMLLSRECDRREGLLVRQGAGIFHVGAGGHEALAALNDGLEPGDMIFSYYRDRPLMVARGYPLHLIASEFFGRAGSSSHGANLPGHYNSRRMNIFPVATPTGSQCLPAVGAAWGLKRSASPNIVVTTIGDAATREGEFYEAVCFAVENMLPVLFVVEDNGFGISTRTDSMSPEKLGIFDAQWLETVDAVDFDAVSEASRRLTASMRKGGGPRILWCRLERLCSHTSSDDQSIYRPADEIEGLKDKDPIDRYAQRLIRAGNLTLDDWDDLKLAVSKDVEDAYAVAATDVPPSTTVSLSNLFGDAPVPDRSVVVTGETMVSAVNQTLRHYLKSDDRVMLFGQDIEDPKGGVFGFTKGLSTAFPDRVTNAPLAEATIVGAGIGLAATGFRPIFEVQFIDFIAPAYQQLSAQAATLRWRSNGEWTCPLVIYAPYGAYLPSGGPWHSQSNEGLLAHIPGIRIAIPSTPQDAADFFEAALLANDPTVLLIPKHVMRAPMTAVETEPLGFGQARVVKEGEDVTIVCWGNVVMDAIAASVKLTGISAEVIDLRSIVPCDWQTVAASVIKTGRLLVVQEDNRTCGFGATIITELTSHRDLFHALAAPPMLLARPDTHVPFDASLESAILPSVEDIVRACAELCDGIDE